MTKVIVVTLLFLLAQAEFCFSQSLRPDISEIAETLGRKYIEQSNKHFKDIQDGNFAISGSIRSSTMGLIPTPRMVEQIFRSTGEIGKDISVSESDLKYAFEHGDVERLAAQINSVFLKPHLFEHELNRSIDTAFGAFLIFKAAGSYMPTEKQQYDQKASALITMFGDMCNYFGTRRCYVAYQFVRIHEGIYCDSLFRLFATIFDAETENLEKMALQKDNNADVSNLQQRPITNLESQFLEESFHSHLVSGETCGVSISSLFHLATNPLGPFTREPVNIDGLNAQIARMNFLKSRFQEEELIVAADTIGKKITGLRASNDVLTPYWVDRMALIVWGQLTDYGTSLTNMFRISICLFAFLWMYMFKRNSNRFNFSHKVSIIARVFFVRLFLSFKESVQLLTLETPHTHQDSIIMPFLRLGIFIYVTVLFGVLVSFWFRY